MRGGRECKGGVSGTDRSDRWNNRESVSLVWSPGNVHGKGDGVEEKGVDRGLDQRVEVSVRTNLQWNSLSRGDWER